MIDMHGDRLVLLSLFIMTIRLFSTEAANGIKHIVMFSFKDRTTKKDMGRIKKGLLNLPKQIPSIQSFELGCDLKLPAGQKHPAGKNRMISWTACFDSIKDYQTYDDHEAHKAFLGQLKEVVEPGSRAAIQYQIEDSY